jgi:hypothetical protein
VPRQRQGAFTGRILVKDIDMYKKLLCDEDDPGGPGFGIISENIVDIATAPVPAPPGIGLPQIQMPANSSSLTSAVTLALMAAMAAMGAAFAL